MPSHRPVRLVAYAAALVLLGTPFTLPFTAPGAAASPGPDARQSSVPADERQALDALDAVRAFTAPAPRAELRGPGSVERGDLTMALRDLANTRSALTGADREAAEALLKRPTDAEGDGLLSYGATDEAPPICDTDICVHYVTTGEHATAPGFVEAATTTLDDVHDWFVTAGYREPKPDGTRGGNAKIDVYLGDIGEQFLYGYCTSDDPSRSTKRWDRWAYCVLDNDYAEFPANTPLENLQVTAAHEYFHATQYAYDRYEDGWLLESTAAWVEDEMYDGVDDNLQYLAKSPLARPRTPLDTYDSATGFHYGTWTFWRYLTERYQQKKGILPRLVLDVWNKADGAPGGPDKYSWAALDAVLRAKKTTGAAALGGYAVANRRPAASYDEGAANHWPTAPLAGSLKVSRTRGARAVLEMDHLTTATGRLVPKGLPGGTKLKLTFDMTPKSTGSLALVTTTLTSGKVSTAKVSLSRRGDAVKRVPFSSGQVAHIEVTMVNGSGRFDCYSDPKQRYSCSGRPLDDNLVQRFTAVAVR